MNLRIKLQNLDKIINNIKMGKKIFLFVATILVFSTISFSQTASASIGSVDPATYYVGQELTVPINVTNFNDIGAITFFIGYDPDVVTFIGLVNINSQFGGVVSYATSSEVIMAWSSVTSLNISSGTLCSMKFVYLGGSCDIEFSSNSEVADSNTDIINWTPTGNVIPLNNAGANTIKLLDVTDAVVGTNIAVPLVINGLANVGAVTLYINYDADKLTFVNFNGGSGPSTNSYGNTIAITWSNTTPMTFINFTAYLVFTYNGIGSADLEFGPGCEVATISNVTLPVSYFDGSVTSATYTPDVTISSDLAFYGQPISETVSFSGFPTNVGAVTLLIEYDPEKLTFTGSSASGNLTGIAASANNGIITIAWTVPGANLNTGLDITSSLIILNFEYLGGGTTELNFTTGTEIRSNNLTLYNANYINATIAQNTSTQVVDIGSITVCSGNEAIVPVTFSGFYQTAASLTFAIGFDPTMLNYLSVSATGLTGLVATDPPVPGMSTVDITWSNPAGVDINTCVIYLHFIYLGGGMADLTFEAGTYMTNTIDVINATYYDGSISQTSISGNVTYDNAYSTPLEDLTVNLKLGATTVATAITDADGFYQFPVCENGSYTVEVDILSSGPYCGTSGSDISDVNAAYDHSVSFIIITDPLKLIAADVNEDSVIDIQDVNFIYDRSIGGAYVGWTLPDWVYESYTINMVGISVVQNIMGICSGDVDGSYVP